MDCSIGDGAGHFLVPNNDYDILHKSLQSESWFQWGGIKYENIGMESLSKDQLSEVHYGISDQLTENFGSKGFFQQSTLPYEQPSFIKSHLVDEDTFMESSSESFGICHEFQYDSMSATDDPFFKTVLDSPSVPSHLYGMNNTNDLKLDEFPPSWGGNIEEQTTFHSAASTFGGATTQTSIESVFHELEGVITQMNEKTRICFRDALYRLAKNSEQQESNAVKFIVDPTRDRH